MSYVTTCKDLQRKDQNLRMETDCKDKQMKKKSWIK